MRTFSPFFRAALTGAVSLTVFLATSAPVWADSVVISGPGVKVENRQGWFGRKETSYQDAMGNVIEKKRGFFGRTSSRTRLFGSEATVSNGNNVTVRDASGNDLITTRRTLFGGKNTQVDGTRILESLKNVFNGTP
jgi:hypothetical protein